MNSALEALLAHHRHWRDLGNDILIVFLIIEFILELWPEPFSTKSPWSVPKKNLIFRSSRLRWQFKQCWQWIARHLSKIGYWCVLHLPSQRKLSFIAALAVAFGVGLERVQGNRADSVSDLIRVVQQIRIAQLTKEAEQLRKDAEMARLEEEKIKAKNLKTSSLLGDRIVKADDALTKLKHFAGTPIVVEAIAFPNFIQSESEQRAEIETLGFAGSFLGFLPTVGWKVGQDHPIETDWTPPGVTIWSRRWTVPLPPSGTPASPMSDPYGLPIDTPRKKAWAAAEALTQYLQSDLALEHTAHHMELDFADGTVQPLFRKLNLPMEAVLIMVGRSENDFELRMHKREMDKEMLDEQLHR